MAEVIIREGLKRAKENAFMEVFVGFYKAAQAKKLQDLTKEMLEELNGCNSDYNGWVKLLNEALLQNVDYGVQHICYEHIEGKAANFEELEVVPWHIARIVTKMLKYALTLEHLNTAHDRYDANDFRDDKVLNKIILGMGKKAVTCKQWLEIGKRAERGYRYDKSLHTHETDYYNQKAYKASNCFEDYSAICEAERLNSPLWERCIEDMFKTAKSVPHLEHIISLCRGDYDRCERAIEAAKSLINSSQNAIDALSQPD